MTDTSPTPPTKVLTFDMDAVTPRMLVDFKAHTGHNLFDVIKDDEPIDLERMDPILVAGFIYIALRMGGNPDATFDEALDMPLTKLTLPTEEVHPPDPS